MKNHKEIFTALLDGARVRRKHWDNDSYLILNDEGKLVSNLGGAYDYNFNESDDWEIKPKEITITRIEIEDAFKHMMSMVKYNFSETDYARDMVRDSISLLFNNKE